jgi:hypothetical protein
VRHLYKIPLRHEDAPLDIEMVFLLKGESIL